MQAFTFGNGDRESAVKLIDGACDEAVCVIEPCVAVADNVSMDLYCQIYHSQNVHNKLPTWVTNETVETLWGLKELEMKMYHHTPEMTRLKAGNAISQKNNVVNSISSRTFQNFHFFHHF